MPWPFLSGPFQLAKNARVREHYRWKRRNDECLSSGLIGSDSRVSASPRKLERRGSVFQKEERTKTSKSLNGRQRRDICAVATYLYVSSITCPSREGANALSR